jgi:FtsP/CotA-like multicopper oxidase with cupredoxin domain
VTTLQWTVLDHVVALLGAAAWFGAAGAAALRRNRPALALLVAAVLMTAARVITVTVLAGVGWWFVQEKLLLALPLALVTGLGAAFLAGRALLRARRPTGDPVGAGSVAALFTAGYGALTGLAVTFVAGYPLDWSVGLIATAALVVASLLTVHVVARPGEPTGEPSIPGGAPRDTATPRLTRRGLINLAGGIAATLAAGGGTALSFVTRPALATGGGPGPASRRIVSVADLRGPTTPAAGGTTVRHLLTAQRATVRLPSGGVIDDAWTYNGQVPGPAIVATQGDLIEVSLHNSDIDDGVTLHWHGYDVPCGEDGAPGATQLAVAPGDDFVYRFRADQTGTYWYHTHQTSHVGVRQGLYGTLVVHPRRAASHPGPVAGLDLTLPLHTFDGTLVVGDGSRATGHLAPAATPVRLRIVNTDSEPHQLTLPGVTFRVAAVDGRDLHAPDEVSDVRLRLPAGGRYDLTFEMPERPVGLTVDGKTMVRVRPDAADETEPSIAGVDGWPELDLLRYGQPAAATLDRRRANRHFTIVLDRGLAMVDGRPAYAHTVNGRGHPSIPDQLVREGDVVRFTVVNRSLETHPWHLHGHPVLVLSRNGATPSGSPLWMDTFDVRPGEVWEVAFEATNPGVWMNHCHNLPHADQGMMLRVAYDGIEPVDAGRHHAH